MRFRTTSITKILPALLVLTMAASTHAQSNSQEGYSGTAEQATSNAPPSRFRFVPAQKTQHTALPVAQHHETQPRFEPAIQPESVLASVRVATLMPATDVSTSPSRFNPIVNSAAFDSTATFETPTQQYNPVSPRYASDTPVATPVPVNSRQFVDGNPTQPHVYREQQVYQYPAPLPYEEMYVPKNRNFFGICRHDVCDEWAGFEACGGLKAYPGHYGQSFIRGCDPCEPCAGRCSKCLIDKHKNKKANSDGCKACKSRSNEGCHACQKHASTGCNSCQNSSSSECSTCQTCTSTGCDDCAANSDDSPSKTGGLLSRFQQR